MRHRTVAEELEHQILDYIQSHNTTTLGTCRDGSPWNATVFYASDHIQLYFFSAPDSRHCENLEVNARVAATIQEDYKDWREIKGIQLEGTVERIDSMVAKGKALAIYARKYPEVIKLFMDPSSGVFHKAFLKVKFYRILPERIYYIDNAQGFGKRQEFVIRG